MCRGSPRLLSTLRTAVLGAQEKEAECFPDVTQLHGSGGCLKLLD